MWRFHHLFVRRQRQAGFNQFCRAGANGRTGDTHGGKAKVAENQAIVEYNVYKNTLIQKALETLDTDYSSFDDTVLKGFTGIIFSKESGNLPAKVIKEFRKASSLEKPIFKGASIDTDLFIGNDQLDALSKLKSKIELIGDVIMLLQSPAKNVISALQSGQNNISGILKTLSEREEA